MNTPKAFANFRPRVRASREPWEMLIAFYENAQDWTALFAGTEY
jgi:hypothetical protein